MTPDQALVDAVALAIKRVRLIDDAKATLTAMARAAIAAVHAHETCSRCGAAVKPPTLCDTCAQNRTPAVELAKEEGKGR